MSNRESETLKQTNGRIAANSAEIGRAESDFAARPASENHTESEGGAQ